MTLDERDRHILRALQENGRITVAELGKRAGLSPSGVQKRLRKLEEARVIQNYSVQLDRRVLGYEIIAFVHVTLGGHSAKSVAEFDSAIQAIPEVLESHRVTGQADYLLKIVAANHEQLDDLLMHCLLELPAVERLNTNVVLRQCKENSSVHLPMDAESPTVTT